MIPFSGLRGRRVPHRRPPVSEPKSAQPTAQGTHEAPGVLRCKWIVPSKKGPASEGHPFGFPGIGWPSKVGLVRDMHRLVEATPGKTRRRESKHSRPLRALVSES